MSRKNWNILYRKWSCIWFFF